MAGGEWERRGVAAVRWSMRGWQVSEVLKQQLVEELAQPCSQQVQHVLQTLGPGGQRETMGKKEERLRVAPQLQSPSSKTTEEEEKKAEFLLRQKRPWQEQVVMVPSQLHLCCLHCREASIESTR